jgi:hypothetical protein
MTVCDTGCAVAAVAVALIGSRAICFVEKLLKHWPQVHGAHARERWQRLRQQSEPKQQPATAARAKSEQWVEFVRESDRLAIKALVKFICEQRNKLRV